AFVALRWHRESYRTAKVFPQTLFMTINRPTTTILLANCPVGIKGDGEDHPLPDPTFAFRYRRWGFSRVNLHTEVICRWPEEGLHLGQLHSFLYPLIVVVADLRFL